MSDVVTWKRACYGLISLVIAQFLFFSRGFGPPHDHGGPPPHKVTAQQPIESLHFTESSLGKVVGDGLTANQCRATLPEIYQPVDNAVSYWKRRGHVIGKEDVNITYRLTRNPESERGGAMRILIHDNELRILESIDPTIGHWSFHERAFGALFNIQNALQSATAGGETLPTIEASLIFHDKFDYPTIDGTHSSWAWTSHLGDDTHQRHWLMPNYDFRYVDPMGSYYTDARRRAMEHDQPWTSKIPKAVWRGTSFLGASVRGPLLEVSKGKDWADVEAVFAAHTDAENYLEVDELCRYAMVIHTEGESFSGRLKFLLNCNSLPIIHELEWMTEWYHLLKDSGPEQNYVKVKRDWSDLEETVQYYLGHPDEAQRIINNHLATFRDKYLTKAAQSCYIRALIQGYSSVSFTPEVYRPAEFGKARVRRGESFELFVYRPRDFEEHSLQRTEA